METVVAAWIDEAGQMTVAHRTFSYPISFLLFRRRIGNHEDAQLEGSDGKLVQRCLKGDMQAWEHLVRTYSRRILNMAYRYTGNHSVAEELTQDAFLKVYQNLNSYKPESGSFTSWIMRVGRNLIIDHYRAHRREKQVAGTEEIEMLGFDKETGLLNPFESVRLREKAELLQRGMNHLTPELREAIILRDIEGFSYQEMAQMLEIPEGTVKSRINRGRIELAKVLQRMTEK